MPPTISPPEYSATSPTTATPAATMPATMSAATTATLAAARDQCDALKAKAESKLRKILAVTLEEGEEEDGADGQDRVDAHVKAIATDPGTVLSPFDDDSANAERKFRAAVVALAAAETALAAAEAKATPLPAPQAGAGNNAALHQTIDQLRETIDKLREQQARDAKVRAKEAKEAKAQMAAMTAALLNGAAAGPAIDVPDSVCVTGALRHPSRNSMNKDTGYPEEAVDGYIGVYDPVLRHGKPTLVHGQQLYRLGKEDKYLAYCTAGKRWKLKPKESIMADDDKSFFCGPRQSTSVTSSAAWQRGVYTVQENGEYKSEWASFASMKIQTKSDQPVYVKDSDPAAGVDVTGLYEPTGEIRNGAPVFQLHGKDLVLELSRVFDEGGSYVIAQPPDADGKQTILYVKSGLPNHHDSSSWYTCNYTAGGTPVRAESSRSNFTVKPSLSLYD